MKIDVTITFSVGLEEPGPEHDLGLAVSPPTQQAASGMASDLLGNLMVAVSETDTIVDSMVEWVGGIEGITAILGPVTIKP